MWAHARTRLIFSGADAPTLETAARIVATADAADGRSDFAAKMQAEVRALVLGDGKGARRCIERVKRINPDYGLLKEIEAHVALAEGRHREASAAIGTYLSHAATDPFRPGWLYIRPVAELLDGNAAAALPLIEEAVDLRPAARRMHLLLAEVQERLGDRETAAATRAQAAALPRETDILAPLMRLPPSEAALMDALAG